MEVVLNGDVKVRDDSSLSLFLHSVSPFLVQTELHAHVPLVP
jgi:hypothetical protein